MVQIDWQYYKHCLAVIEYIDLAGCGPGGKSQLHYKVDGARGLFADIGFTIFGSLVFEDSPVLFPPEYADRTLDLRFKY
ncbi:hypothetical protein NC651_036088 [Populus alba x Populus x berolinensis]|nr:hypothetical protein NC651_036088 [Populus alba x Populus x berolinensis]